MRVVIKSVLFSMFVSNAIVLGEPPVSDGYPSARSSDHHDYQDYSAEQRSIASEYGAPSRSPSFRSGSRHSPPTARVSFTQRFSSDQATDRRSQDLSQDYGAPAARSLPTEYGAPEARALSQEYGPPVIAARNTQNLRAKTSKALAARSQFQADSYTQNNFAGKSLSRNAPPSTYGAPSSRLSPSYGVPSARDSESYSQEYNDISPVYGAPSQRGLSDTYGAPVARGLSQEYGAPSTRASLKTQAVASSYSSASSRSSPSSSYLPATRSMPSQQYGVPDDNQGYDAARARALEELLNQAPANYDFSYQIEDSESGGDFGHSETRLEDRAEGSYFVVLPDGTKQTVQYSADEEGFKPRVTVEPVGGYDANAAGPY